MSTEQKEAAGSGYTLEERSLAYQMRQSLLKIAQSAQMGDTECVDATATTAMQLIDCYLLGSQSPDQLALHLEAVSLGAIMQDVLHQLTPLAKQHECQLHFMQKGTPGLVTTDARLTKSAFIALGQTFIESTTQAGANTDVVFGVRSKKAEELAGVFSPQTSLRAKSLQQLRRIAGKAAQPCDSISGSSAGIVLADVLLSRMSSQLRAHRFMQTSGIAANFSPSQQLQLV